MAITAAPIDLQITAPTARHSMVLVSMLDLLAVMGLGNSSTDLGQIMASGSLIATTIVLHSADHIRLMVEGLIIQTSPVIAQRIVTSVGAGSEWIIVPIATMASAVEGQANMLLLNMRTPIGHDLARASANVAISHHMAHTITLHSIHTVDSSGLTIDLMGGDLAIITDPVTHIDSPVRDHSIIGLAGTQAHIDRSMAEASTPTAALLDIAHTIVPHSAHITIQLELTAVVMDEELAGFMDLVPAVTLVAMVRIGQ